MAIRVALLSSFCSRSPPAVFLSPLPGWIAILGKEDFDCAVWLFFKTFPLFCHYSDHIECALDCLSDRSMFVATSARSLITKFLIKMSDWMVDQNIETAHGIWAIDDKCAIIVQRLKSMLNPETLTPTTSMAVIEVTRMLLCENSMSSQKVLQDTKLFPECLNLVKTGDATVCQKLVDVICEMAKNR